MGSRHKNTKGQRHTMKFILAVALILCFSCALCNAAECQDSDFIANNNLFTLANAALEIGLDTCEHLSGSEKKQTVETFNFKLVRSLRRLLKQQENVIAQAILAVLRVLLLLHFW